MLGAPDSRGPGPEGTKRSFAHLGWRFRDFSEQLVVLPKSRLPVEASIPSPVWKEREAAFPSGPMVPGRSSPDQVMGSSPAPGYAGSERIDRALVLEAIRKALLQRRDVRDLIHHSDRGGQYASHDYRKALDAAGITCSMNRRGNCRDNAVAESFFSSLEKGRIRKQVYRTRDLAKADVFEYIEMF